MKRFMLVVATVLLVTILATSCSVSSPPTTSYPTPSTTGNDLLSIIPATSPVVASSRPNTTSGWQTFTTQDGLAHNVIYKIIKDAQDNLWFATAGGVSRYDGTHWKSWTTKDGLIDNKVTTLLQDRKGDFWFGTDFGLSYYDGKSWRNFTKKDGLPANRVWAIMQDKQGTLWVSTYEDKVGGGVSRYDGKSWSNLDEFKDSYVLSIFQDNKGTLWFGMMVGVRSFDGKIWHEVGLGSDVNSGHQTVFHDANNPA